jgi:hypothetical protein
MEAHGSPWLEPPGKDRLQEDGYISYLKLAGVKRQSASLLETDVTRPFWARVIIGRTVPVRICMIGRKLFTGRTVNILARSDNMRVLAHESGWSSRVD